MPTTYTMCPYVEQGKFDECDGSVCHPISLNSSQNTCDEPLEISFDETESTTYCRNYFIWTACLICIFRYLLPYYVWQGNAQPDGHCVTYPFPVIYTMCMSSQLC